MAVDMFIKLNGIKGESQDAKHKDSIDVLAWSYGASNSGSTHIGGGSGSGKASFQDLNFTKYIDKSSPVLMLHTSNGKHIPDATLTCRKAGGTPLEFLILDMKDIIVSSVSLGGSGGEDRLTENVSLNFGSFKYKYVEQTKAGGAGAQPDMQWDIAANTEGF